jgi:hypothetical protein
MGNFDKNLEKLVKFTLEFFKSKFSQIIYQKIVKFCPQKKITAIAIANIVPIIPDS